MYFYVFYVNTGFMYEFNMESVYDTITDLRPKVYRDTGVTEENQVYLISGGDSPSLSTRFFLYSTGTDSNPLFLFNKAAIETENPPPLPVRDMLQHKELKRKLGLCLNMPAGLRTIQVRTELAREFYQLADAEYKFCSTMLHMQHFQYQGWTAAVANLDETVEAYRQRVEQFFNSAQQYLDSRDKCLQILYQFNDDVNLLKKIQMLPCLLQYDSHINVEMELTDNGKQDLSLLQWLASKDCHNDLGNVARACLEDLEKMNPDKFILMRGHVDAVFHTIEYPMREIKGLEDRLAGLDAFVRTLKAILLLQNDIHMGFRNNFDSVKNIAPGDIAIIRELCDDHSNRLKELLKNHNEVLDIELRMYKGKEEFVKNIHQRLRWTLKSQQEMTKSSCKLMGNYNKLNMLKRKINLFEQIHTAPQLYLKTIVEIVRRKQFSKVYYEYTKMFHETSKSLVDEECIARRLFNDQFGDHFLRVLFPGLNCFPHSHMSSEPKLFDTALPDISVEEVEEMQKGLPSSMSPITLPECSLYRKIFQLAMAFQDDEQTQEKTAAALKEEKDLESETDTEEFEKVGSSPINTPSSQKKFKLSPKGKEDKEDLETTKAELDILRSKILGVQQLKGQTAALLRGDLTSLKDQIKGDQATYCQYMATLSEKLVSVISFIQEQAVAEQDHALREVRERLGDEHRFVLEECQSMLQEEGLRLKHALEEGENARNEVEKLKKDREELKRKMEERHEWQLNEQLAVVERKHSDKLKRLNFEHQMELDVAQQATVLRDMEITQMREALEEKSSLLSNLEEQNDTLQKSLDETKSLKAQCSGCEETSLAAERLVIEERAACEVEYLKKLEQKEKHFRNEMENLRSRFRLVTTMERSPTQESTHEQFQDRFGASCELTDMKKDDMFPHDRPQSPLVIAARQVAFNEAIRHVADEKNLEISQLRQKEETLNRTIKQIEKEFAQMKTEYDLMKMESSRREMLESNSSSCSSYHFELELPRLTGSEAQMLAQARKIQTRSFHNFPCLAIMTWNEEYQHFVIFGSGPNLHFIHAESLDELNIKQGTVNDYLLVEVTDKEHCFARKDGNRYHVPKGTKFYRMKVKLCKEIPQTSTIATQATDLSHSADTLKSS